MKTTVVLTLSTPALRIWFPLLFHFKANIGPLCWPSVLTKWPKNENWYKLEHKNEQNTSIK